MKKKCSICKQDKDESKFRKRAKSEWGRKDPLHAYCISCSTKRTKERKQLFKQKAVHYKGGECQRCGYSKTIAALEFHHRDPSQKDFEIAKIRSQKFENATPELDKCDLVCANCHREIHEEMKD